MCTIIMIKLKPSSKSLQIANLNKFKLYISAAISGSRKDNTITKDAFESAIPSDKFS